jgi:ketosteroid isomerase-like protein
MGRAAALVALAAALVVLRPDGARAQQAADGQAVLAANREFYEAVAAEDPARLAAVWAQAPYVRAIHPPSKHPDAGWEAVRAGFENLFASWSGIAASMPEPSLRLGGDVA